MRQVRNNGKKLIELALYDVEIVLERFELVRLRVDFGHERRRVLAFGFCLSDLLRELIALRLQLLRALGDRLLKRLGALGLGFSLAAGGGILANRLDRHQPKEDGAKPDDDPEPAEDVGEAIRLGGEDLALLDAVAKRLPLAGCDLVEFAGDLGAGPGEAGGIII